MSYGLDFQKARINYRRPNLAFGGVTVVGLDVFKTDGVNNYAQILFPDGDYRTETNTTRRTFNITRNAVLTNSGAQSGLRASLSEVTNQWYAIYAVKISDNPSGFVAVGDTTLPYYTSFPTLDTAYGANNWVYLGMIRNGDNSGVSGDILNFVQVGNRTIFKNVANGNFTGTGIRLATTTSASSLTYTYSAGIGAAQIPDHILIALYSGNAGTNGTGIADSGSNFNIHLQAAGNMFRSYIEISASSGLRVVCSTTSNQDIFLNGIVDPVLTVTASQS